MPWSQQALFEATRRRAEKLEARGKPADCLVLRRMQPDVDTADIRNTCQLVRNDTLDGNGGERAP